MEAFRLDGQIGSIGRWRGVVELFVRSSALPKEGLVELSSLLEFLNTIAVVEREEALMLFADTFEDFFPVSDIF